MKTVKEWFESVKDKELRNELLSEMFPSQSSMTAYSLYDAMLFGFVFSCTLNGEEYWQDITKLAMNNEIETI